MEPVLDLTLAWYWPQVWRIENLELVPVESRWLGHFYGGDCYLLLYTYLIGEKPHYLLYIWQVRPRPLFQNSSAPTPQYPCQVAIQGAHPLSTLALLWLCDPLTLRTPIHNNAFLILWCFFSPF